MGEKKKLKLAIALSGINFSIVNFDKKEMLTKDDTRLREIDEEYTTTIVNIEKYKTVLLTTTIITEFDKEEQNKVIIFLVNSI